VLPALLIDEPARRALGVEPGARVRLRGRCTARDAGLPPVEFRVAGIVDFKFGSLDRAVAVTVPEAFARACATAPEDEADLLLVASRPEAGTAAALAAIRQAAPRLHAFSNSQLVSRVEATDFSYFRQISFALVVVTLFFAFLLIATLLTVSVNQRFGEIAALRAIGFTRRRVVADLVWESALFVGTGGLLAIPLGLALASWLDRILRSMPGFPEHLRFFVFGPRAALAYVALLGVTALAAATYPVLLAARLPIAATLRRETVG
jgi:putative ABC transport system permease protein